MTPPIGPHPLDITSLLAPINGGAGEAPHRCEAYLSFRRILKEEQGRAAGLVDDGGGQSKAPDWHRALLAGERCLKEGVKDLAAGCWMSELLLKTHGLPGLEAGLILLMGLMEGFPEELHPQGDPELRAARLQVLAGRSMLAALDATPLNSPTPNKGGHTLGDLLALRSGRHPRGLDWKSFEDTTLHTPPPFFEALHKNAAACITALLALTQHCDQALPPGALSLTPLRERLEAVLSFAQKQRPQGAASPPTPTKGLPPPHADATPAPLTPPLVDQGPGTDATPDLWARAQALLSAGQADLAISLIQGALDRATSGRGRFLLRLQLAELCIEGGLTPIARPLLVELSQVAEQRRLVEWERPEVWARLCAANLTLAKATPPRPANPQALQIFDQLARADAGRALQHLTQHPGDIQ